MGELAALAERRELRGSALWPDRGAPEGRGRAVVLVQGFGVPARTLAPLGRWLASGGWRVAVVPLGVNVGCSTVAVDRVVETAVAAAEATSGPVTIIGHSRGGLLGKVAAVRRPDLMDRLVTVCTPWIVGPPDRPGVAATSAVLGFARRHGLDLMGSLDCGTGPCCAELRTQVLEVPQARWTCLWSSADRIAGGDAATDGATTSIDLGTSHLGAVMSVPGWSAIRDALG